MVTLHAHPPPATKGSSPARVYPVCLATSYLLVVVVRDYPSLLKKPNGLKKLHVTPLDFSMTNKASRFSALVCHRTYELPTGILWPSSPAWAASAAIQLQVTPISKPCESFGWKLQYQTLHMLGFLSPFHHTFLYSYQNHIFSRHVRRQSSSYAYRNFTYSSSLC